MFSEEKIAGFPEITRMNPKFGVNRIDLSLLKVGVQPVILLLAPSALNSGMTGTNRPDARWMIRQRCAQSNTF